VQLLQEGRIGHLRFVMDGENADDYMEWCRTHGTDPSDESAEFYIEQGGDKLMLTAHVVHSAALVSARSCLLSTCFEA